MIGILLAWSLLLEAAQAALFRMSATGPAPAPMGSPAAGPSGPAGPVEKTINCNFVIENLDYEDVAEHPEAQIGVRQAVKNLIDHSAEKKLAGPAAAPGPAPSAPSPGPGPALIQLKQLPPGMTISINGDLIEADPNTSPSSPSSSSESAGVDIAIDGSVDQAALSADVQSTSTAAPSDVDAGAEASGVAKNHTVNVTQVSNGAQPFLFFKRDATANPAQAPGGPAPSPVAAPVGAPGPSPGPMPDVLDTYVALSEGPEDSVEVNAWVHYPPAMEAEVKEEVKRVCRPTAIANALLGAEGVEWAQVPVITGHKVGEAHIEPWGQDCGPHVQKIISQFSVAYTRRMVPMALNSACHLFQSKLSFSGNRRITKWDRKACQEATGNLMEHWKFGKGNLKEQFDHWCHDICELKLGKGAPHCGMAIKQKKGMGGPGSHSPTPLEH